MLFSDLGRQAFRPFGRSRAVLPSGLSIERVVALSWCRGHESLGLATSNFDDTFIYRGLSLLIILPTHAF